MKGTVFRTLLSVVYIEVVSSEMYNMCLQHLLVCFDIVAFTVDCVVSSTNRILLVV